MARALSLTWSDVLMMTSEEFGWAIQEAQEMERRAS